jgi:hypothetical protein
MSTALNATKDDGDAEEVIQEVEGDTTQVVATEVKTEEPKKVTTYSWFVLAILVAIRVIYQWQRSIFSYSFGYKGVGLQAFNPIYEIGAAYP